ncbi:hypothetical protein ALI22I_01135 [Saccharothrix sp. ALI-22-I]|uniref:AfsR/SARP family transcriptional regulator n=1 Tax=Saccharothrix sp. ALI-22-I TaxID=1933778 RepID=UPI00097CBC3D|nr:BTAD domain-containing putative transcriptional regulator [Saccharothrix sp. ALI-22-I]ONI92907.1 hypothetical protein ALI22I_01135 [Saccharothrix sp. ALI-22-I]
MAITTATTSDAYPYSSQDRCLHLFGGPYITVAGERQEIPTGSQRLLVLTALHRGRVDRHFAAGLLWPIGKDQRAAGNLRSAIWRLRGAGVDVIRADNVSISLRDDVAVDARFAGEWARRLIDGSCGGLDLALFPWLDDALDLLPGWYDDWVIIAREQLRQRVLHALEGLSRRLCEAGRLAEGVEAAMTAVAAEPLRESAQRVLIEAHLAEYNLVEARRAFEEYRTCVRNELGVAPSPALARLVSSGTHRALRAVAPR